MDESQTATLKKENHLNTRRTAEAIVRGLAFCAIVAMDALVALTAYYIGRAL